MAEVEISSLEYSQHLAVRHIQATFAGSGFVEVPIGLLAPRTTYRARMRFRGCISQACSNPTPFSDWHYRVTSGTERDEIRATIVQFALREWADASVQLVGYNGAQIDGTRYGASGDELWSEELYGFVAEPHMDFGGAPPTSMLISRKFFQSRGVLIAGNAVTIHGRPGDWVAIDTDGDGIGDHAGMLLAYDEDTNRVWSVEGESRNSVAVAPRPLQQITDMATVEGLLY
jgi:hypothetical protein